MIGRRIRLALALGLLLTTAAVTAEETTPYWDMNAAERDLELWRHELLAEALARDDARLDPFTTDGCSGGLSASWEYVGRMAPAFRNAYGERPPWEDCCIEHDRCYHGAAGIAATPLESFDARKRADLELRACVIETRSGPGETDLVETGLTDSQVDLIYEAVAELMYRAVRLGGVPCTTLPWRWGYGWPACD